jgi:hypothetical protein
MLTRIRRAAQAGGRSGGRRVQTEEGREMKDPEGTGGRTRAGMCLAAAARHTMEGGFACGARRRRATGAFDGAAR